MHYCYYLILIKIKSAYCMLVKLKQSCKMKQPIHQFQQDSNNKSHHCTSNVEYNNKKIIILRIEK